MIKIEFSGSGEEVRNEMLKLLGLPETKTQIDLLTTGVDNKATPAEPPVPKAKRKRVSSKSKLATWTQEDAEKFFSEIKPNAKRILSEIATKPEGYKRSELELALGISGQTMRGRLSSVGAAIRRLGEKPYPISKEKVDGELIYKIDPVVAEVAKKNSD